MRERELAAQQAQQQTQQAFMMALADRGLGGAGVGPNSEAFMDIVNPSRGKFGIAPRVNPQADKAAGLILPAQYGLFGDLTSVDISNAKNKIKSGKDANDDDEIVFKEIWPNQFLNRMLCGKVKHHQLDHLRFCLGFVQKIFCDMPGEAVGTPYHNMTRVLIMLLKLAVHTSWPDVLAVNEALFMAMERRTLTWLSWPDIKMWWDEAMATMSFKKIGDSRPAKRPASDTVIAPAAKQAKNTMFGIPHSFFKDNNVCKKFNLGRCNTPAPHASPMNAGTMLRHICAGCLFAHKESDGGHGMTSCPKKPSSGVFA